MWAHNTAQIREKLGDAYGNGQPEFDVRNNVIYDFGEIASGLTQGHFTVNYVDNYLRAGPSSKRAKFPIHMGPDSDISFYLKGNVFDGGNTDFTEHNEKFVDAAPELQGKPVAKIRQYAVQVAGLSRYDSGRGIAGDFGVGGRGAAGAGFGGCADRGFGEDAGRKGY